MLERVSRRQLFTRVDGVKASIGSGEALREALCVVPGVHDRNTS